MKFIIDRFEGDYAVCESENSLENDKMIDIPVVLLPMETKEGDMIIIEKENNNTKIVLTKEYKINKLTTLEEKYSHLWK